jgi:hypothetical protein
VKWLPGGSEVVQSTRSCQSIELFFQHLGLKHFMPIIFGDVQEWNINTLCVCTALSAVTGVHPSEVGKQIALEAQKDGQSVAADPGQPFNINHWSRVVRALGGQMNEVNNLEHLPYELRQTISQFLANANLRGVHLVFGENKDRTATHVFAYSNGQLVDTYTLGKRITAVPEAVPEEYNDFHVKRVFQL